MTTFAVRDTRKTITLPILTTRGEVKEFTIYSPPQIVGAALMEMLAERFRQEKARQSGMEYVARDISEYAPHMTELYETWGEDDSEVFHRNVLGEAYDEMLRAYVDSASLNLAFHTVQAWVQWGLEAAQSFWESDGDLGKVIEILGLEEPEVGPKRPQDHEPKAKKKPKK